MNGTIFLPCEFAGKDAVEARGRLLSIVNDEVNELMVDGEMVVRIDAVGLGVLVMLERRLRSQGGRVKLCNASPALEQMLDKVRLRKLFCA